jgi:predicted nuclease of predicted toxin-antitoxin system
MKLLFDQNLSHRLLIALEALYPGTQHIREQGLDTASDDVVWNYARDHGMTIVSKDSDFYHRSMLLGHPPKVVWVRLGNCTTVAVAGLLQARHGAHLRSGPQRLISNLAMKFSVSVCDLFCDLPQVFFGPIRGTLVQFNSKRKAAPGAAFASWHYLSPNNE